MKKGFLLLFCCLLTISGFAAPYINIAGADLSVPANWTSDGTVSGTPAANFTTAGDVFNLSNDPGTQSWVGTWTIGSAGSAVTLNVSFTTSPVVLSGNLSFLNAGSSLTTSAGATLDLATFTFSYVPTTIVNNGTIRTAAAGATPIPSGKTWSTTNGTVEYYGTGSQTIVAGTYSNNLTISGNRTGQTLTFAGAISVGNALTFSATGSPSFITTGNTITYAKLTGGLTIASGIPYNNLTLANTSGTNTADGNITVAAALQATGNAAATFDLGGFTLSVGTAAVTNTGTILVSSTSATPLSSGNTWAGTVKFTATGGGQTIPAGTYTTLTLLNTSGSDNASGAVNVNTALNTTAGGTLDMGSFALGGTLTTVTNNGTIRTAATGTTPITPSKTIGGTGTIEYYGTNSQTIVIMTISTGNLTISGDRTGKTITFASGNVSVNGALTFSATGSPTIVTTGGQITYSKTTGGQTISSAIPYFNLSLANSSGTNTADGNISVSNILNMGAAAAAQFADAGFTVTLSGAGIVGGNFIGLGVHTGSGKILLTGNGCYINFTGVCGNLELNSTGFILGASSTLSGAVTFTNGNINLNGKTLTIGGAATSLNGMSATNCFTGSSTSNLTVTATANVGGTIYFDQTTPGTTNAINVLTTSGAGGTVTLAASAPITVATMTLTSGTINDGGNTITLTGNLTGAGTHTGTGKILMTGNGATIGFTGSCGNLELNSTGFSLSAASTLNGPVTFTSGNLSLNGKVLTLATGISFTGMDASHCFTGGAASGITYSSTGTNTIYFDQTTPGTSNLIGTLITSGAGGVLTLPASDPISVNTLTLTAGTLADGGNVVTVNTSLTGAAAGAHTGSGKILMNGATITFAGSCGNLELDRIAGISLGGATTFNGNVTFTNGKLAIGANTLTLGVGCNITGMSAANSFTGSGALSNITITATASVGTLFFDQTTPGTTDNIGSLTLTPAGAALTLGSNMSIVTALALTNATSTINDNGFVISCNGNITGSGIHNSSPGGKIVMQSASLNNISGITIGNIEFNNAGAFVLTGSPTLKGTMTFTLGTLTLGAFTLTIGSGGSLANMSSTSYFTGSASSNLTFSNTGSAGTIFFNQTTPGTATTVGTTNNIATLTVNTGASVTLGSDVSISTSLALVGTGAIADGGFVIKNAGTVTGTGTHTSTGSGKMSFIAAATKSISNAAATYGNIEFNSPSAIAYTSTGNPTITGTLTFTGAGNTLTIGTNTITLNGTVSGMSATKFFTGSATSNLTFTNSGAVGTVFFGAPGATNTIQNFKLTGGGNVTLGNSMISGTLLDLTSTGSGGIINVASGVTLTLAGTFNTSATQYLSMNTGGLINVTSTNPAAGTLYFDPAASSFNTLTITGLLGVTTLGNDITVGTLALAGATGTIADGGHTITVTGSVSGTGKHTGSGSIKMTGASGSITGAVSAIGNIEIAPGTGNSITLSAALTTNGNMVFSGGNFSIGANTLTLGPGTAITGMSSTNAFTCNGATSNLTITNTSSVGTLFFDQTTPGTTDKIATLTLTPAGAAMTLGSNMSILTSLTLTNATSTINDGGFIITNAGAIAGAGLHNSTGSGKIVMTGVGKAIGATVTLGNLELNAGATSAYSLGGAVTINGTLTFTGASNSITIGSNTLTLKGAVAGMSATKCFTGSANSNLTVNTAGSVGTLFFNPGTPGTTNKILAFTVLGGGLATTGNDLNATTMALTNGKLAVGPGALLTVTGAVTGSSATNYLIGSATSSLATGTASTYYFDQTNPGVSNNFATLTMGASVHTLGNALSVGNLVMTAGGTLADGGNTVTVSGNITGTGIHSGTGKITMTGAGKTISAITPGNLEINPGTGNTINLAGALITNGNFIFSGGNFAIGANTLTLGPGTAISGMSASNAFTGNGATSNLTITNTSSVGTLFFDQTTPGTTDNIATLTLTPAGSAMTLGSNMSILTSLTLSNATSTINDGGFIITNAGAIAGAGVHNSTGSGKIVMTGVGKAIGVTVTLGNLELNAGATSAYILGGAVTINGTLTFTGASNSITIGSNTLTLKGVVAGMSASKCLTGSGTSNLTVGSTGALGTLFFNPSSLGTATTVGTSDNFATFTVNSGASVTLGNELSVSTTLALPGTAAIADGGNTIKVSGSITGTGSHTGTGKVSMITAAKNISGVTLQNLELNMNGATTLTGNLVVNGLLNMSLQTPTLGVGSNTLTLNGSVSGMSATHYLTGSATSNLTIGATVPLGTLFFNPTTPNTTNKFDVFTMNGVGGTATLGNALSVGTTLALTAGTVAAVANNITIAGNGSITGTGTHTSTTGVITMGSTSGATISGATLGSLTIANAANVSLTGSPVINGTLSLTTGIFDIGANNLTFGPSATFAGTASATNMLYSSSGTPGEVRRQFTANGSFVFPVGDNTPKYSPITLNFTGGSFAGGAYAGVKVIAAKDPHNSNSISFINRYWTVNTSGITSPAYQVTNASYSASDVVPTEGNMALAVYNGAFPWVKLAGSTVNTGTHTLAATGTITSPAVEITGFNAFATPVVNITSPAVATICSGGTVELDANAIADPLITYSWAPATGLSSTTAATVFASPSSTTTYTVTITDGYGGTASNTYTVTVTSAVSAAPSNDGPICNTGTVNLMANGTGASVFAWSGPNLSSTIVANPSATPTATATYSLTVTDGTTNPGCVQSYTTSVTVNAQPTAAPTNNGPICQGATVSLTANPTGASTYSWAGPNLSSGTAQNPTATPTVTSTYSLTVSAGSGSGCAPATVYTTAVTVNPPFNIGSIGNNGPLCAGTTLNLTSTPSGGTAPFAYSWSGPAGFTSTSQNPVAASITTAAAGVYSLSVTDAASCISNPATTTVVVYATPSMSSVSNNGPLCSVTTTLNLFSSASGGTGTFAYAWAGPSGFTSTLQNPSISSVPATADGVYTVTVTDANGCVASGTNTTTATIHPTPSAGTITGATGECIGASTTVSDGVAGGTWSLNGAIATIDGTGSVTGVTIGADIVSYTVSTAFCSSVARYAFNVEGTTGNIYTVCGTGVAGYTGDGGAARTALIKGPRAVTTDTNGNVYFCDVTCNVIRKIAANGIISTVVGTGTAGNGGDNGLAVNATLSGANGVFVDKSGNIYISNTNSHTIRKVNGSTGVITTIAGTAGLAGSAGDGGPATSAKLSSPLGVCADDSGNVYIADQNNHRVRRIDGTTGLISTIIGTGSNAFSGDGGPGTAARVAYPRDVAIDKNGNLYVADAANNRIRKYVIATGIISTLAGTGTSGSTGDGGAATAATFWAPARISYDGGSNLYIADQNNNKVRYVDLNSNFVYNLAGNGGTGFTGDGGAATAATVWIPCGVAADKYGNVFIADANNRRLRAVPAPVSVGIVLTGPSSVPTGTPITFTAYTSMENNVSYQWKLNGSDITGATNSTYTDASPVNGNTYLCIVTVAPECGSGYTSTSNSITVSVYGPMPIDPAGVNTPEISRGLTVYPNPFQSAINVDGTNFADGVAYINVYDQMSRIMLSQTTTVNGGRLTTQLDLSALAGGMYIVSVTGSDGKISIVKCLKN